MIKYNLRVVCGFFFAVLHVSDIWAFCFDMVEVSNCFFKMCSTGDCSDDTCGTVLLFSWVENCSKTRSTFNIDLNWMFHEVVFFLNFSSFTLWNCRPSADCQNIRKIHASKKKILSLNISRQLRWINQVVSDEEKNFKNIYFHTAFL